MQTIKASEFKAKCLSLMDEVNATGEEVIITKNGKPVSKLIPFTKKRDSLFGLHQAEFEMKDDLIESVAEQWGVDA